jgi:hypothetical protein
MTDIIKMRQDAEQKHKEVFDMITRLSDTTSSDGASTVLDRWLLLLSYANSSSDKQSIFRVPQQVCESGCITGEGFKLFQAQFQSQCYRQSPRYSMAVNLNYLTP